VVEAAGVEPEIGDLSAVFQLFEVRELWSQPVDVLLLGSIS
jgi:hypothetical protein